MEGNPIPETSAKVWLQPLFEPTGRSRTTRFHPFVKLHSDNFYESAQRALSIGQMLGDSIIPHVVLYGLYPVHHAGPTISLYP